jgi:phage terminase large subunit-like protein
MPRRVITAPGHSRTRSLGWLGTWWIETFTVHGPGDIVGEPTRYGDEYTGFIVDCYALDENGRRLYDSAFLSRPKGCDKSGLAARLALFEAFGPARFDGWAKGGEKYEYLGHTYVYQAGEPMGRPVTAPLVRILATEEEQTGNTYGTIHYNLTTSTAPLFELQAWGVVAGLSQVVIPGGGVIKRSTAGAKSKDGGLETFAVFDETHLYSTPQLHEMYETVVDNLGKRAMTAEPWYIETTTMFLPGEESVAEETYKYADEIGEGRAKRPRLLFDHRWGEVKDFRDEDGLADAFREAYGDAIAWNPVQGLIDKALDPRKPEERTRRMRLNTITGAKNAWIKPEFLVPRGISRLRRAAGAAWSWVRPWKGDTITLGFDGALTDDATALVAVRVKDLHVFPILIQEVPDGPEAENWEVDRVAFDAAVSRAFKRYKVVGFYADPPHWQDYVDAWAKEFGQDLAVKSSAKHAIAWWTKRDVQMAEALERFQTSILVGDVTFDDETPFGRQMMRHFQNARKWSRRGGTVIGKEGKNSPKKIDAAMAATLAFKAASDYTAKKTKNTSSSKIPVRLR